MKAIAMTKKKPTISIKLDRIRKKAHALYGQGFRDEAIELMRISRGEVKIEAGTTLFGLTAVDMQKAKMHTLQQRLIIAANIVDSEKFGATENDYDEAVSKIAAGDPSYPKRNPKDVIIKSVAHEHQVSESSLRRFMKTNKDWKYENPTMGPDFEHPDWHPDLMAVLFNNG
jgi:hypothetical protein